MALLFSLVVGLHLLLAFGATFRRHNGDFVTTNGDEFQLGGSTFHFYGTNLYWAQMVTDQELDTTFQDIATAGFQVVRTWAFNDVSQKPASGTYFQVLKDGTATVNTGADGLQRLDKVVAAAKKHGLKVVLTLSNNWNPDRPQPSTVFKRNNNELPRAYLSNDYGGMDMYNRAFVSKPTHDEFYTNSKIIDAFKNYISQVIPRFAHDPTVVAWELANDLRCASTLPASSSCNTQTITKWVADISSFVKKMDPNHLITAGDSGFYCLKCPKLYAQSGSHPKRSNSGPSFDGSYGVDTEDIICSPSIDFGSFQIFPDQVQYFTQTVPDFATNAIAQGNKWVTTHSDTAAKLQKPEALLAFGIVTKAHSSLFVPFNGTSRSAAGAPSGGVEDFQHDFATVSWAMVGRSGNIGGSLEYYWLENNINSPPMKRDLQPSANDGNAGYPTPFSRQNAMQQPGPL